MNDSDLRTAIITAVTVVAKRYGLTPPVMTGTTCPMAQIPGMDSLHAIEAIVEIAKDARVPDDNNVFWDDTGRFRTVDEIAGLLAGRTVSSKGK